MYYKYVFNNYFYTKKTFWMSVQLTFNRGTSLFTIHGEEGKSPNLKFKSYFLDQSFNNTYLNRYICTLRKRV